MYFLAERGHVLAGVLVSGINRAPDGQADTQDGNDDGDGAVFTKLILTRRVPLPPGGKQGTSLNNWKYPVGRFSNTLDTSERLESAKCDRPCC